MTDPEPLAPPVIEPETRQVARRRAPRAPSWWARNRWGLIALPLALLLALAAASDRLSEYWWGTDLRVQDGLAAAGETATLTQVPPSVERGDDGEPLGGGDEPETETIGIGVERIDRLTALDDGYSTEPLPGGTDAYELRLALSSDAPIETTCTVMLVGSDGARYGDGRDPLNQYGACSRIDEDEGLVSGPTGSWTNEFTILTAAGAEIDHAIATYDGVHFVRLELP
ncbi:MAG: hypothetical protein ACTHZX_06800 [Microbacterium sp.]